MLEHDFVGLNADELLTIIDERNRQTAHMREGSIDYTGKGSKWQKLIDDARNDTNPEKWNEMM